MVCIFAFFKKFHKNMSKNGKDVIKFLNCVLTCNYTKSQDLFAMFLKTDLSLLPVGPTDDGTDPQ